MHLPFCAHFIFSFLFLTGVELSHFPIRNAWVCLVYVICNSNSIHYFIFKLCIMVAHTLKMCTFYFVQISFVFTFLTDVELRHFQAVFIPLYSTLYYDCLHIEYVHPIFMHI